MDEQVIRAKGGKMVGSRGHECPANWSVETEECLPLLSLHRQPSHPHYPLTFSRFLLIFFSLSRSSRSVLLSL